MAGLLTYALFESLPILPDSYRDRNSDYSIFKKLVAITAAGTVADSPDASVGTTAFPFQIDLLV